MFSVEIDANIDAEVGEKVQRGIYEYLKEGADRGVAEASDKVPVDRGAGGGLLSGIFTPEIEANRVVWGIRDMPHARAQEFGTRPYWPPIRPLKEWANRLGKDEGFAYAVQYKIAQEGIDSTPYMRPGRDAQANWYSNHDVSEYVDDELR